MSPTSPAASSALATDKTRLSIACALGASLAFSINDITVKSFSGSFPLHEVVLIRALVALALTVALLAPHGNRRSVFQTRRLPAHLFRGLCVVVTNMAFFAALAALPLAETSAIFFVAPLLITAFSAILLKESVGVRRWSALVVGLVGVLLIVKPGTAAFQWALLLPAISAVAYASLHTMTRSMGLAESAATMAVYIQLTFIVVCSAMGLVFGAGQWSGSGHPSLEFLFRAWLWPAPRDWALLMIAGACSAVGGYLISQAYRHSAAALVAPFEYSALVLAAFWGFTIWGEIPGPWSGVGIVLILASGLFVALREGKLQIVPTAQEASGRR
ncbi:MAG: DMT family transporter [Rhodoferax sp.]|jgi:drug/metabolite transporter (DMT)-like permease|nr:DMT family transporter [Rhodoferax sp.]